MVVAVVIREAARAATRVTSKWGISAPTPGRARAPSEQAHQGPNGSCRNQIDNGSISGNQSSAV
eukprot:10384159-Prorocentrum_lima.AAC.1